MKIIRKTESETTGEAAKSEQEAKIESTLEKIKSKQFKGMVFIVEEMGKVERVTEGGLEGSMAVDASLMSIDLPRRDAIMLMTGMEDAIEKQKRRLQEVV